MRRRVRLELGVKQVSWRPSAHAYDNVVGGLDARAGTDAVAWQLSASPAAGW
jgi:hypothetical protein